jgi:N-acetyl sugar amidotransferase
MNVADRHVGQEMQAPLWSDEVEQRIRKEACSLDTQVKDQPKKVVFCKRCVISNQRPRIVFDEEGVCSACRYAEWKKENAEELIDERGCREFSELLNKHRGQGWYDVIVPASGGKDSAPVAHRLKTIEGMNPLCAKMAPHMYTDIGFQNMQAANMSGLDFLVCWAGGALHRKLARLALEYVGDPFLPFIYGQLAWPVHVALNRGTRLIMGGENQEAEYGGDPSANDKPGWDWSDWERVYQKGVDVERLLAIGLDLGAITEDEQRQACLYYFLPEMSVIKQAGIEYHWYGYYMGWHPQSNYYYACENTGFQANPEGRSEGTYSKYASLDDKLDGLHYYMGLIKFGLGRCSSDAAHEIRDGDLTREEGVALVKRYDQEHPTRHDAECLEYLGIDCTDHLETIYQRFAPDHLWRDSGLKHTVWDAEETTDR